MMCKIEIARRNYKASRGTIRSVDVSRYLAKPENVGTFEWHLRAERRRNDTRRICRCRARRGNVGGVDAPAVRLIGLGPLYHFRYEWRLIARRICINLYQYRVGTKLAKMHGDLNRVRSWRARDVQFTEPERSPVVGELSFLLKQSAAISAVTI